MKLMNLSDRMKGYPQMVTLLHMAIVQTIWVSIQRYPSSTIGGGICPGWSPTRTGLVYTEYRHVGRVKTVSSLNLVSLVLEVLRQQDTVAWELGDVSTWRVVHCTKTTQCRYNSI